MRQYWILFVVGDNEPELRGKSEGVPFTDPDERNQSARKLRPKQ